MLFLIPVAIGLGVLLVGCASEDKDPGPVETPPLVSPSPKQEESAAPSPPPSPPPPLPQKTITAADLVPRGIPLQFFSSDPTQMPLTLADELQKKTQICTQRWGNNQQDNCSIYAATRLAPQSPLYMDTTGIKAWAKGELARFYENYLKSSPQQRVSAEYFILIQNLEETLLTSRFGQPLTSGEIDHILAEVRSRTGLTHVPPSRKTPVTWEEIMSSDQPVEVRTQDIPRDLQTIAKQMKLPKDMAAHLGLPTGKNFWDFISENTDTVIFAKRLQSPYSVPMMAEAKTFFFKTIVLDVNASKNILKDDYLVGLVSSLAHECYHNYFHNHYKMKDERYVNTFMLNERNAHLFGAEMAVQYIRQKFAKGTDKNRMESLLYYTANDLTVGMAANACLAYESFDRKLHADIPSTADEKVINKHPAGCIRRYLGSLGMDENQFFNALMRQLEFF